MHQPRAKCLQSAKLDNCVSKCPNSAVYPASYLHMPIRDGTTQLVFSKISFQGLQVLSAGDSPALKSCRLNRQSKYKM